MQLINLSLFSQHCFLSHFTPQYPQLTMPFHSTTTLYIHISTSASSVTCSTSTTKKHHLNLLSSITKALLTHTLASFWWKQSCIQSIWWIHYRFPNREGVWNHHTHENRTAIHHFHPSITVTSQWATWRLKSPASRLFTRPFIQAQIKENTKAPRHWPLCGEFTGDRWTPRTNGQ